MTYGWKYVAEREIDDDAEHDNDDVIGPAGGRAWWHRDRRAAWRRCAHRRPRPGTSRTAGSSRGRRSTTDAPAPRSSRSASIGCLSLALMWLGMKAAVKKITANSIRPTVMCRMNAGGDQICDQLMRAIFAVTPDDHARARRCATDARTARDSRCMPSLARIAGARAAKRHEHMGAEKHHQAENEDVKPMLHSLRVAAFAGGAVKAMAAVNASSAAPGNRRWPQALPI